MSNEKERRTEGERMGEERGGLSGSATPRLREKLYYSGEKR